MSEKAATKGGKKNRKFGRSNRSPAMKRYIAENRRLANKARHCARAVRQMVKARAKRAARDFRKAMQEMPS